MLLLLHLLVDAESDWISLQKRIRATLLVASQITHSHPTDRNALAQRPEGHTFKSTHNSSDSTAEGYIH